MVFMKIFNTILSQILTIVSQKFLSQTLLLIPNKKFS